MLTKTTIGRGGWGKDELVVCLIGCVFKLVACLLGNVLRKARKSKFSSPKPLRLKSCLGRKDLSRSCAHLQKTDVYKGARHR